MSASDLYSWRGHSLEARLRRLETGSQRIQGGKFKFTNGVYRRIPAEALDANQNINITSSALLKKGGVSISGNTSGFAYASDGTSITWYWDGTHSSKVIVIHRADGSRFTVPTAGSGLTVSGLSLSTTYYFLPYWDVDNLCNIGWVQGTVGSPQIAFVAADITDLVTSQANMVAQTLQTREALSGGYMSAATTAGAPGGGGAGGGGAGGHCVMAGTMIEPLGGDYSIKVLGNDEWVYLRSENGQELFCTASHPLYHAERGKIAADTLTKGDIVITNGGEQELEVVDWTRRKCSLWQVMMPAGHLYWANGFLSHNKVSGNVA